MRSFVLTRLQCRSVWPGLCFVLICSLLSLSSWSSWLVSPAFALTREASKTAGPEAAGPEAAGPEAAGPEAAGRAQPLTVLSQDGRAHEFRVEVADSGPLRELGLMFREELAPDYAMLFDFEEEQNLVMWMKDTPLSLDMFFADASGLIFHIAESTVPFSEDLIAAPAPGRYVLETPAGTAKRLGLQPGDMLLLP